MKKVEKSSKIPLYYQLFDLIKDQIDTGELREDDKLPSERELCEIYDISRFTVRQAIKELENKGYIYIVQGKGTFVSEEKFKQDLLKFYSFTEEMKSIGKKPSSKVLSFDIIKAPESIARKMNLSLEERVYVFARLRSADQEPMMFETTYLPYRRFKNLTREKLENYAMYDIFTKEYGISFTKAEEILQPVLIREAEAYILNCSVRTASMMIERITYEGRDIIEYTKSVSRGDKFKYRVTLEK
nr:GntR family transcriptional regulator [Tissierella sp.]